jgi:hypothetical protein
MEEKEVRNEWSQDGPRTVTAGGHLGALARQLAPQLFASQTTPSASAPSTVALSSSAAEEFTAADVSKHNKKDDIWVIMNGQAWGGSVTPISTCFDLFWDLSTSPITTLALSLSLDMR